MPNRRNNNNDEEVSNNVPISHGGIPDDPFTTDELLELEGELEEDSDEIPSPTQIPQNDDFRVQISRNYLAELERLEQNLMFGTNVHSSNENRRTIITSHDSDVLTRTNPFNGFDGEHSKKEVVTDPETVITLRNGNKALFKYCACINGKFYLKTDKDITTDYFEPDKYVYKGDCSCINTTFDDNGYITNVISFYDPRFTKRNTIVEVRDGKMHVMSDYNTLPKQFYTECITSNIWYHNSIADKYVDTQKRMRVKARKASNIYKPIPYKPNLKKDYEMGVKSPSFIKTEGKRYSYGRRKILINY